MIPILLDPWLVKFSSNDSNDEMNAKMGSLRSIFIELSTRYPLDIVPFINEEEQVKFWREFSTYRFIADKRQVVMFINSLSMSSEPQCDPAVIMDTPCPESLPQSWLKILATKGNTNCPPAWRFPMLFTQQSRRSSWPVTEFKYTHNGSLDPKTRNLVIIEEYRSHRYFLPDIDPWRLGCVGDPIPSAALHERKATCRRLPRPPLLPLNIPLSQLAEVTSRLDDCTCGTSTHYYFLPPASWLPTDREMDDWRNNAFIRDGIVLKDGGERETGYRDKNDHVWVWDEGEPTHWDVKTEANIRIVRVRYDGLKLPS